MLSLRRTRAAIFDCYSLPDDFVPSVQDKATEREIDVLNEEREAGEVRVFVGGLRPASEAKSLRAQPEGKVLVTDGPYLETREHIGGFWILEAADLDKALAWGRKAVLACRVPVEVRQVWRPDGNCRACPRALMPGDR